MLLVLFMKSRDDKMTINGLLFVLYMKLQVIKLSEHSSLVR